MDLNRATTFVRVVETGGFTRAAESLGVPTSSVSRSVQKLEEDLGITLLERTTRHVGLTDAGRAYFERARDALAGLEEATALALDAALEAHGLVRLAIPLDFAGPIGSTIAAFARDYPRIRIEVVFSMSGAELVGDVVDVAMAIGKLPDSTALVAKRLGNTSHRLFAAPTYLALRGKPKTLADLAGHDGIFMRAVGGEGRWELDGPKGSEVAEVPARFVGDHQNFVVEMARAGLGVALLPSFFADPLVAAGALEPVLAKYSADRPLHVVTHASRHIPRRVSLMRDYLIAALSSSCKAHGALT